MLTKIDTFSANSLKLLEKNPEDFINKYIYNLSLFKKDKRAVLGQKFHSLLSYYIKGFNIEKLLLDLDEKEISYWKNLEKVIEKLKNNFIKTEYSFLIKEELEDEFYYLTGRFDAIYLENDIYTIYDWKTLNIPLNPENDLQTVVYLYCAAKIFNTEKIKMRYLTIEKLEFFEVHFEDKEVYKDRIDNVIKKLNLL